MIRYLSVFALSFIVMVLCHWPPAAAVTVELEIESESEPVPGASISFETSEGEPVALTELVSVENGPEPVVDNSESVSSTDGTATEPDAEKETASGRDRDNQAPTETSEDTTPPNDKAAEKPGAVTVDRAGKAVAVVDNHLLGKDLVLVVRKDGQTVKRQALSLDKDSQKLKIEAYDPADALLSLDIAQPSICSRGKQCEFILKVSNGGTGIYVGPIFFSGSLPGSPHSIDAGDQTTQSLLCSPSGQGRQFCHLLASLEPGSTAEYTLPVQLSRQASANTSACLELVRFDEDADEREGLLVRAVQHGLATRGLNPGTADGRAGPKTRRAIEQFLEKSSRNDSPEHPELVGMLYDYDVDRLERLGLEQAKGCTSLTLKQEPKPIVTKTQKPKPAATKTQKPKPAAKSTRKTTGTSGEKQARRKDKAERLLQNPAVQFGVGVGINSLQNRGGRSHGQGNRRKW